VDNTQANGDAEIAVLDMPGKCVFRQQATVQNGLIRQTMELPMDMPNGAYLVKVTYNGRSSVVKYTLSR
jgi:hypothetical protein